MQVYDPTGRVSADNAPVSPRLARLDGVRIALLDNGKWNAGKLLRGLDEALTAQGSGARFSVHKKSSFSRPADEALLERIAGSSDAAITAIGD